MTYRSPTLGLSPLFSPAPRPLTRRDELFAMWSAARAEANMAYDAWATAPGVDTYSIYRAAEDRADAAQDALADELVLVAA